MDLSGNRVLVAGATGEFGAALARRLAEEGTELALAGRDAARLGSLADELGAPTARFEARDGESCRTAVAACAAALGGLDALVVSCGAAAFAPAGHVGPNDTEAIFAANALGPIALVDAALGHIEDEGAVVGVTAIVAEHPTAGVAHYSAAKAAFSAYLAALRRERRRDGLTVVDVRPPHMDTGFAERPVLGAPPRLPAPIAVREVVDATVAALRDGRREVAWDLRAGSLVTA